MTRGQADDERVMCARIACPHPGCPWTAWGPLREGWDAMWEMMDAHHHSMNDAVVGLYAVHPSQLTP